MPRPYTLGEAEIAAAQPADPYHRELMAWLCNEVRRLQAMIRRHRNAVKREREACAKICDDRAKGLVDLYGEIRGVTYLHAAADAIRERL